MANIDSCLGQGAPNQKAAMAVERIGLRAHYRDALALECPMVRVATRIIVFVVVFTTHVSSPGLTGRSSNHRPSFVASTGATGCPLSRA